MQNKRDSDYTILSSSWAASGYVPARGAFEVCGFPKTPWIWGLLLVLLIQKVGERREMITGAPVTFWR